MGREAARVTSRPASGYSPRMLRPTAVARSALSLSVALAVAILAAHPAAGQLRAPDMSSMDRYVFGILSRGASWTPERTPRTDSIQAGHMANIRRMAALGALIGAGPFQGDGAMRGVFIFRDLPPDSIRKLCADDPAIRSGRLALELHPWMAPAGIGDAYRERAKQRPDKPDSMIAMPLVFLRAGKRSAAIDSTRRVALQRQHLDGIMGMLLSGELLSAGPFLDRGEIAGIGVFSTDSASAAARFENDPLVRAGELSVDTRVWWTAWGVMPPRPTVRLAQP